MGCHMRTITEHACDLGQTRAMAFGQLAGPPATHRQLQEAAESGDAVAPAAPSPKLSAAEQVLRTMPAELLAAELQRRGWAVMEP